MCKEQLILLFVIFGGTEQAPGHLYLSLSSQAYAF